MPYTFPIRSALFEFLEFGLLLLGQPSVPTSVAAR
jgi:hypothetical protein